MLVVVATVLAVVAAVRGMWSPCGLSMLATMTPMSERLRGHRFATTATFFIFGALLGGASLGGAAALGAGLVKLAHPTDGLCAAVAVGFGIFCLLADSEVGMIRLPAIRRQLNERWVEMYRPSVYAGGFGWQLGAGLTTYVMTAANYLLVALGIASGSPWCAFLLCCTFGATRGLVLLVNTKVTTSERLFAMHRFLDAHEELSKLLCIGAEALVIAVGAALLVGPGGLFLGVATFAIGVVNRRRCNARALQHELISK